MANIGIARQHRSHPWYTVPPGDREEGKERRRAEEKACEGAAVFKFLEAEHLEDGCTTQHLG